MSRRIVTSKVRALGTGGAPDTYFERMYKLIPGDIVAAWVVIASLIESATDVAAGTVLWIAFACLTVLTPFWLRKQTSEDGGPLAVTQIVVSTVAFIVWVFALGGPFVTLGFYRPLYGSVLLIIYTLAVGVIEPKE